MRRNSRVALARARPFWGVVAGLFVLLFGAMASGAAVHHALHHHDADAHAGHCEVCSFAKSQVEAAAVSLAVCQPATPVEIAATPTTRFVPQNPSSLLPPGRAPPILAVVS